MLQVGIAAGMDKPDRLFRNRLIPRGQGRCRIATGLTSTGLKTLDGLQPQLHVSATVRSCL